MLRNQHRLGNAGSFVSMMEPDGGLQPSIVQTGRLNKSKGVNLSDEDSCPEQSISSSNRFIAGSSAFTPAMLEALAATDEISTVLERIVSYVAVQPDIGSSFAYCDFKPGYQASLHDKEKTLTDMTNHWNIIQDFLFNKAASLSIGIHQFIQDWLTYGDLTLAIIREVQFGKIIDIHIQRDDLKETKDRLGNQIWLTDCEQIIWEKEDIFHITYVEINPYVKSYVSSLMRTYNMFKTVERTRVANAIMAASFRTIYTVPTSGLGKVKARQKLSSIMGLYKRDVRINDANGEVTVNGENTYPVNTELWVAETTAGAVKIDNPGDGNPDLNDTQLVDYFMRKYYKQAKLPMSKYEAVDAGYLNGLSEIDEDERQFQLLIQKYRAVLSKLFLDIIWRMMSVLTDYAGREELRKNMTFNWYDEPKHESPSEALDGLSDVMDRIEQILEKYSTSLENAGFSDKQITARLNVLRIKLMRKYAPDLLEQTQEDYRNIPEEEDPSADESSFGESGDDFDFGEDSELGGGTDDFSDWGDDDWDSEIGGDDDWSMPDESADEDFDDGFDFDF